MPNALTSSNVTAAGDLRTNQLNPARNGLVSGFKMHDFIGMLQYPLAETVPYFGQKPVGAVFDFVMNPGAINGLGQGYSVEVFLGALSKPRDIKLKYGYADVEQDAVLAAFAQDNIPLGSNYQNHTIGLEYQLLDHTYLNLAWYLYQRKRLDRADVTADDDQLQSRFRLDILVKF